MRDGDSIVAAVQPPIQMQENTLMPAVRRSLAATPKPKEEQRLGGSSAEEVLKKRATQTKELSANVEMALQRIDETFFEARKVFEELHHSSSTLLSLFRVAEARVELRSRRSAQEGVDRFKEDLETERAFLTKARKEVSDRIRNGKDIAAKLEAAKAEILPCRLTLAFDRTGETDKILEKAAKIEQKMHDFYSVIGDWLSEIMETAEKNRVKTTTSMRESIQELSLIRRRLEKEIQMTGKTLVDVERQLDRKQKELARIRASPEKNLRGSSKSAPQQFKTINERYAETLSKLRSRIKGASYTGTAGRQLDVLLRRFDKDNSGELSEDELRAAFRRTIKVPRSILSDADIHSLCRMLDSDGSGSLSIKEVVEFLESDVSLEDVEKQCEAFRTTIQQLTTAKAQAVEDLRSKTACWHVDTACSKVTAKRLDTEKPSEIGGQEKSSRNPRRLPSAS